MVICLPKPIHSLEKRLLKVLNKKKKLLEEVAIESSLSLDQTRRAVEWLKAKGMLKTEVEQTKKIFLDNEGKKAALDGLPERRLVEQISKAGGKIIFSELKKKCKFTPQEFSVAFGNAKKRGWIIVSSQNNSVIVKLNQVELSTPQEEIIKKIFHSKFQIEKITPEEKKNLEILKKRPKYIKEEEIKKIKIYLTPLGVKTVNSFEEKDELDKLTPELLVSGGWKGQTFRHLDVEAPSPILFPGKKHPVQNFIDEVREIFVALGFEEIIGSIIQPCFWNFDALFIPQDHPAREMQDTFYLSDIKMNIIEDKKTMQNISRVHENGGDTGSIGWGYKWEQTKSKDAVLRTHTTAATIKYLSDYKPKEARVFSIGRVFRNEKVTYKNSAEFHQIEGIAVGEKVTLRDIMGLLGKFYSKLGLKKVKFWPTFFPYTEPSLQSMVYFEEVNKWVELCGMGIFRPEVTEPLGVKNPVLAWGGGLERLVMLRLGITDIRELYSNNLDWLRRIPMCR